MLIHFGNNATSGVQSVYYFITGKALPLVSLWSALAGLLAAALLLYLISRLNPRPASESEIQPATGNVALPAKSWLGTYWPLFIGGLLYAGIAGLTVVTSLQPKPAAASEIQYGLPSLSGVVRNHYDVQNEGGQTVGDMECTLQPARASMELDCTRTIRAFEYQGRNGYFKDTDHSDSIRAAWDEQTMELVSFSFQQKFSDGSVIGSQVSRGSLTSTDATGTQEVRLAQYALVEFEWAWHAALLKANAGQSFRVSYADLMSWDNTLKKSAPSVKDAILQVYNDETLSLPQGDLVVRKLTLESNSAWYAREDALAGIPRPVKFDDGMYIYILTK